jgi:hypothetical protein
MSITTDPPHLIGALADLDARSELNTEEPEAPARRQHGARFAVYLDGSPDLEVTVDNRDRIAYEMTAARHKEWPAPEAGQHFAMTFCLWSSAKRTQQTALTFEQWRLVMVDYDLVSEVPADPTR